MKKRKVYISVIIIIIAFIKISAQNKPICGDVYYEQTTNFSMNYKRYFLMKFNNNQSYSEERKIRLSEAKLQKKNTNKGLTNINIPARKNLTPDFFYNTKDAFYFMEVWFDEPLVVKENSHLWQWQLLPDVRKIGNFICQKATTTFRGRNYIAWFTNKIPVPFGPWKFKDLPGLILEVYDIDRVFHVIAKNINIGKVSDCTISFNKDKLKKTLTITNYLKKKKELINADFARLSSKMGRTRPLKMDENCDDCSESIEIFNKNN